MNTRRPLKTKVPNLDSRPHRHDKRKDDSLTAQVKGAASQVVDKGRTLASTVTHQARDAYAEVCHQAHDCAASAKQGLDRAGQCVRDQGRVTHADLALLVRRNPMAAVLASVGAGFLVVSLARCCVR